VLGTQSSGQCSQWLALQANRVVSIDRLVEGLWAWAPACTPSA
jgi:hypothetical protein